LALGVSVTLSFDGIYTAEAGATGAPGLVVAGLRYLP
jgi:hypothetical protein